MPHMCNGGRGDVLPPGSCAYELREHLLQCLCSNESAALNILQLPLYELYLYHISFQIFQDVEWHFLLALFWHDNYHLNYTHTVFFNLFFYPVNQFHLSRQLNHDVPTCSAATRGLFMLKFGKATQVAFLSGLAFTFTLPSSNKLFTLNLLWRVSPSENVNISKMHFYSVTNNQQGLYRELVWSPKPATGL